MALASAWGLRFATLFTAPAVDLDAGTAFNKQMGISRPVKEKVMKIAIMPSRSVFLAGATATLAMAALVFADSAQARDNVYWSVGVGAPGVSLNVGNAGPAYGYAQPVYFEPEPIYYQPSPVYVRPAAIY